MRWQTEHRHLEEREIAKFAWLPVVCKRWDRTEIRWLETVRLKQTWCAFGDDARVSLFGCYWENNCFV